MIFLIPIIATIVALAYFIYKWRRAYPTLKHTFRQSFCDHQFIDSGSIAKEGPLSEIHKVTCRKCGLKLAVLNDTKTAIPWDDLMTILTGGIFNEIIRKSEEPVQKGDKEL